MFFVARRDGSEVFELVEEPLDEIAQPVEKGAEDGDVDPSVKWTRAAGPLESVC